MGKYKTQVNKMNKKTLILLFLIFLVFSIIMVSCSSRTIHFIMPDGSNVEIEIKGLTKEQIEGLKQASDDSAKTIELIRSDLFTLDELMALGLDFSGKLPNSSFGDGIPDGFPDKNEPGTGN